MSNTNQLNFCRDIFSSGNNVPDSTPLIAQLEFLLKEKALLDANVLSISSLDHKDFYFGKFYEQMANQSLSESQS